MQENMANSFTCVYLHRLIVLLNIIDSVSEATSLATDWLQFALSQAEEEKLSKCDWALTSKNEDVEKFQKRK